ncbi:MAG: DUF1249 domain-containing protein [Steroidobacterales bacterium]
METDQLCIVTWRTRPRSFVSLMTLYESNFIRFGWLARDLKKLPDHAVSLVRGDCDLSLTVTDRCRYTTSLLLTYRFNEGDTVVTEPNLELRLYHDARLLEACGTIDCRRHRDLAHFRVPPEANIDRRWTRNQMLNKWLEYCAERGHRFPASSATRGHASS